MRPQPANPAVPQVRWAFPLLLAGSLLCSTAILLFPWLVHWEATQAALAVWYLFSHLCHQELERGLALWGSPLPVCSRCLALYLGGFLGILFSPLGRMHSAWVLSHRALMLLGPAVLMSVDVGFASLGVWENTAWSRGTTGGLLGFALGLYTTLALEGRS